MLTNLPYSCYQSICRHAVTFSILVQIMNNQSTMTGFTMEMSISALSALVPISTSAIPATTSLAEEIKRLHSSHKTISKSHIELKQRLNGDPQFISCIRILFQLDNTALVEWDDGTLIQKCNGCSRNTKCNDIIVSRKQKNNGNQAEETRKKNYDKQVAHNSS